MRILIADDAATMRAALRAIVGGETCEAGTAESARAAMSALPPDVAFVDVRLDGDATPALIAELARTAPVVVTATPREAPFVAAAVAAGAAAVLEKPFRPALVDAALAGVLAAARRT